MGLLSSIGGAFSLGSSIYDAFAAKSNAAYQNRLGRNAQIDVLQYQNEYNKPINQMARLKEAGLNPNLVYGSITTGNMASVGSPQPMANYREQQSEAMKNIGNLLTSMDLRQKNQQIQSQKLDNEAKRIKNTEAILKLNNERFKFEKENPNGSIMGTSYRATKQLFSDITGKSPVQFKNDIKKSFTNSLLSSVVYLRNLFRNGKERKR